MIKNCNIFFDHAFLQKRVSIENLILTQMIKQNNDFIHRRKIFNKNFLVINNKLCLHVIQQAPLSHIRIFTSMFKSQTYKIRNHSASLNTAPIFPFPLVIKHSQDDVLKKSKKAKSLIPR